MNEASQFFRAGVGILVCRPNGEVLALRRTDVAEEAWQLPQGGLDAGEEPEEAMWRELGEETGLTREQCELVGRSKEWLAYELPVSFRSPKVGRGQVQRWFLCRFTGRDEDVAPDGREFDRWRWMPMDELIAVVAPFRRPLYERLAAELAEHLG